MSLLLKLLGLVDVAAATILFFSGTELFSVRIVLSVAGALLFKGVVFSKDPVSKFDIILGIYVASTLIADMRMLDILFGLYIGLKGIYSMF